MINNVVILPGALQSDSVAHMFNTYTYSFSFFSHLGHTEYGIEFAVLHSRFLLLIYFNYALLNLIFQSRRELDNDVEVDRAL